MGFYRACGLYRRKHIWLERDDGDGHTVLMGATTYRLMSGFAAQMPDDIALALVERRTFDGRLQLLEYVPTVLDGSPGAGG